MDFPCRSLQLWCFRKSCHYTVYAFGTRDAGWGKNPGSFFWESSEHRNTGHRLGKKSEGRFSGVLGRPEHRTPKNKKIRGPRFYQSSEDRRSPDTRRPIELGVRSLKQVCLIFHDLSTVSNEQHLKFQYRTFISCGAGHHHITVKIEPSRMESLQGWTSTQNNYLKIYTHCDMQ